MPRHQPGVSVEDNVAFETGWHCLTDGHGKYIWYTESGREQFFDLDADPGECHDLTDKKTQADSLRQWRKSLINILDGRPEGFTDGDKLIPGCSYEIEMPHLPESDRAV